MSKKVDSKKLQRGNKLSRVSYMTVLDNGGEHLTVQNEDGFTWVIGKDIIEKECLSGDQFTEEKKVTKTELVEIFGSVRDSVFTVCFNKQPKAKDINEAINSINKGKILTNKQIAAAVKSAYAGEERILTGYLINTETGFGRSTVIDLNIAKKEGDYDNRLRQVDHRSINWLINNGVKYTLK